MSMNSILNMKRRVGLGLLWIPGVGLPLTCLELFANRGISDEDRALCWTILLTHFCAGALTFVFFIGVVLWVLSIVYAILTFCGLTVGEVPGLTQLGRILARITKPDNQ